MPRQLIETILKRISFISGIVGLASININSNNLPLPEDSWFKGIEVILINDSKYVISIAIIIDKEIRLEIISREILVVVKQELRKQKLRLAELKIFVRGIQ